MEFKDLTISIIYASGNLLKTLQADFKPSRETEKYNVVITYGTI